MIFLSSCEIVSVKPGETGTTAATTDEATDPASVGKCFFEVKESGASPFSAGTSVRYADGTAAQNGAMYPDNTTLRVEAFEPPELTFLGWSVGKSVSGGGEIVSTELSYTVNVTGKQTYLYANYENPYPSQTTVTYHLNGGAATNGEETFVVTVDTSYFTSPNTLYDGGGFTRSGYVLLEYNTKADGTGDAYSPGSKANAVDGKIDLYCIWARASTGFTTENTYVYFKKNLFRGVAITGYSGDDETLVIPETIGGEPVVSIRSGAIVGKSFHTLVFPRTLKQVEDGAFIGCTSFHTLYMGDGIVSISDDAFDSSTRANWHNFRLSATTAPRYASGYNGGYRVKWDRLMRGVASGKKLIVFVSGSSSLHGIATGYLERLLGSEYFVVEYGTIRSTNNMIYTEAIANFVGEGDIVVYAPENSIYQFGCPTLTWMIFRDLESSQNVWRYIDIGRYSNVLGAFQEYQNQDQRQSKPCSYLDHPTYFDPYGDFQNDEHKGYCKDYAPDFPNNHGYFTVTLDERVNSVSTVTQNISLYNPTQWIDVGTYASDVRRVLGKVTATGAKVYFGFCPVNENALTETAKTKEQQAAFDRLISGTFGIELLGSCSDHLYRWEYMYNSDGSDFHLNDYGRAYNTYKMYTHLCQKLNLLPVGMKEYGTVFPGCLFE